MFELFAGIEAERNEAEEGVAEQEEQDDDCDPAHHTHALWNVGHADSAAERALGGEGGGLLGRNDLKCKQRV